MCFSSKLLNLQPPTLSLALASICLLRWHFFGVVTVYPIRFHPLLGKTTFHPIAQFTFYPILRFNQTHVSTKLTFQPNSRFNQTHVLTKLTFQPNSRFNQTKSTLQFHRTFFIRLIHLAHIFIPIITHKHMDRFASNFDWGTRENHGNVLR